MPYLGRYREADEVLFTAFNPCLALGVLVFGAVAVTAGVIADADMLAPVAFVDVAAQ